jgi:hypothetical protein
MTPISVTRVVRSRTGLILAALLASFLLALILLSVFVLPSYLITHDIGGPVGNKLKPSELLKATDDVRKTLLQGIGGLLFLATAFFTWQQLKVSRENQTTEQFTKAIDHLGSDQIDVRVGGIYALERIARASKQGRERGPVLEILTSYVRRHATKEIAPVPSGSRATSWFRKLRIAEEGAKIRDYSDPSKIPPLDADVDAALLVLARRTSARNDALLQLARTDLRRAMLATPKVKVAQLGKVNMQEVLLPASNLQDADLTGADLWHADLRWSNLQGAKLCGAHLREADLRGAEMQKAKLQGADLTDAKLEGTMLLDAEADGKTKWPSEFAAKVAAAGVRMTGR